MDPDENASWDPVISREIIAELDRLDPQFIAASILALREGAARLLGDDVQVDVLGRDGAAAISDRGWDVLQNEAEGAFRGHEDQQDPRLLIDASYDPAWRAALRSWAQQNPELLVDGVRSWPSVAQRAALLDLAGYRVEFNDQAALASARLAERRLPCNPSLVSGSPEVARIAMMVWRAASTDSPVSERVLRPESTRAAEARAKTPIAAASPRSPDVDSTEEGDLLSLDSQAKGASLEESVMEVFELLWSLRAPEDQRLRAQLRRQHAGTQYGADVVFRAGALRANSTCLVECKNYSEPIRMAQVAEKVLQAEGAYDAEPVDHWILISPHTDPTNELDRAIQRWNELGKFPFTVQVWSPQSNIRQLLAISPHAFEVVYGTPPPEVTVETVQRTITDFEGRLKPTLRVPRSIATYLTNDRTLVRGSEADWLPALESQIERRGTDDAAGRLDEPLEDEVVSHLLSPNQDARIALLMAEFGEGKSFFTVSMCRRLRSRFIADPTARNPIPIRMFLRDYRHWSSPLDFLKAQLDAVGVDLQSWYEILNGWSVLLVLDGMDEMSVRKDPATTRSNLEKIGDLIEVLEGVPVLITSRMDFFAAAADRERFYDRLRRPRVFRLAKPDRRARVAHLRSFATAADLSTKLNRIKELHDPIGLAGKVLFLDMIKETLADLPEDRFDESVLYETYVKKALTRKLPLLRDPLSTLQDNELLDNLERLLERVAVAIHVGGEGTVDLRDFLAEAGGAARLLWQAAGEGDIAGIEHDASTRIGTRSLLTRASGPEVDDSEQTWKVDFFHRSMKEYFVARAIHRALHSEDPFIDTRRLLMNTPMQSDIVGFYRLLCGTDPDAEKVLLSLARGAFRGSDHGALGGGAITLLHAHGHPLGSVDWRELDLDGALLGGTDLRGADLRASTLRGADLSSADLRSASLQDCDLSGANLDAADTEIAITPDGTSRRWICLSSEGSLGAIGLGADDKLSYVRLPSSGSIRWPRRLSTVDEDLAFVTGDAEVSLVDLSPDGGSELAVFRISNAIRGLEFPAPGLMGVLVETDTDVSTSFSAVLVDLPTGDPIWRVEVPSDIICARWATDFIAVAYEHAVEIIRPDALLQRLEFDHDLVALELVGNHGVAVLASDGSVGVAPILGDARPTEFVNVHAVGGSALGVNGSDIVSVGADGALAITRQHADGTLTVVDVLARRLQCTAATVDRLETQRERLLLLASGAIETTQDPHLLPLG